MDQIQIRRVRKGAPFEFSVCSGHLETFDNLDVLLSLIENECRNPPTEPATWNCPCELENYEARSYAENYYLNLEKLEESRRTRANCPNDMINNAINCVIPLEWK